MEVHRFFRGLHKRERNDPFTPDEESFTRLRPSTIHGVGVFAIRDIPKDTNISRMMRLRSD